MNVLRLYCNLFCYYFACFGVATIHAVQPTSQFHSKNFLHNVSISKRFETLQDEGFQSARIDVGVALPGEFEKSLGENHVDWQTLDGLAQQRILWNHGYVFDVNKKLTTVYTRCAVGGSGIEMDQLVLELQVQQRNGCARAYDECGVLSQSSLCDHHTIESTVQCAIDWTGGLPTTSSDITFLALEARNRDIPLPIVHRLSTQLASIHMSSLSDATSGCSGRRFAIPCKLLSIAEKENNSGRIWCRPTIGYDIADHLSIINKHSDILSTADTMQFSVRVWVLIALLTIISLLLCILNWQRFIYLTYVRDFSRGTIVRYNSAIESAYTPISWWKRLSRNPLEPKEKEDSRYFHMHIELKSNSNNLPITYSFQKNSASADLRPDSIAYCDVITTSAIMLSFTADPLIQKKRIPFVDISFSSIICQGASGEICKGCLYANGINAEAVALKRLIASKRGDPREIERFAMEIQLTASLCHPNIVRYIGVAWNTFQQLVMVLELKKGGDLLQTLQNSGKKFTWNKEKLQIGIGIIRAILYLHSLARPVIHRDIKSKNILVDATTLEPALCDFGLSCSIDMLEFLSTDPAGTILWTAPEIIKAQEYSRMADIYSFGIVLTELDTCRIPFNETTRQQGSGGCQGQLQAIRIAHLVVEAHIKPKMSEDCPQFVRFLVEQCLHHDPELRPTAKIILDTLLQIDQDQQSVTCTSVSKNR
uniref:Protein kinase putative n=1 Tax=Albugo laibachii Nc14 TaxID=890382 RepID=F0W4W6_9STRA|nr:protein kinase putative [Albugo laibachii Nc14]|eukprot:CCA16155.1 protein kinase putative [Albugo laibachii Nc14]